MSTANTNNYTASANSTCSNANSPSLGVFGVGEEDAANRKVPSNVERMFETFHQTANGEFKPTFYNPFEVKHRRRTTRVQFKILERAFLENQKPTANVRRSLAMKLGMTPRAVQVWFQNRRAKLKSMGGISSSGSVGASPDLSRSNSSSDLSLASHSTTPKDAVSGATTTLVLEGRGRANSCPNIDLPFKQLHEALFGGNNSGQQQQQHQSQPLAQQHNSTQMMRPRSGSAMPPMVYPKYPQYAVQQPFMPFSAGVYLPPSATMVPFVYPHDLMYVPHHHPQFYTHGNLQVPIDPSLLINGDGLDEDDDGVSKGLDLDYFSTSPKPSDIVIEDEPGTQQHQQQQNVSKSLMIEPIDLNGMMMGNSEAFLMSLVDDHHLMP